MVDVVLVEYQADINGIKAQLAQLQAALNNTESAGKKSSENIGQGFKEQEGIINSLKKSINDLKDARDKSNDTSAISAYNKKIDEANSKLNGLTKATKEAGGEVDRMEDKIKNLAERLAAAFALEKIYDFAKESVKAFAELESATNKLNFAVTKIGGEGESAFKKLTEQAEKFSKTSIFSTKDILNSQTLLSQFGLTSEQIKKLTPQIIDMASATGSDLGSATQQVIQGINGQTRGLKQLGITYEDAGSKTANLAILTDKLTKFQGSAGEAFETTAGKAKRFDNAIEEIKESLGKSLVEEGNKLLDILDAFSNGFDAVGQKNAKGALADIFAKQNEAIIEDAKTSEAKRQELLLESDRKITAIAKKGLEDKDAISKAGAKLQLENEQKLNDELRNLNTAGQKIKDDLTQKGLADAKSDAEKLAEEKKKALKDLLDFDKKTQDEELKSEAQTDLQKLELTRDSALKELQEKTDAARKAGVDEKQIVASSNADILNIFKQFNNDKAALDAKAEAEADKKRIEQAAKDAKAAEEQTKIYTQLKDAEIAGQVESESSDKTAREKKLDAINADYNKQSANLKNLFATQKIDESDYIEFSTALNKKKSEDIINIDKLTAAQEKQLAQQGVQLVINAVDAITKINDQKYQQQIQDSHDSHDSEVKKLDDELKKKQISQSQYDTRKAQLDKKAADQQAQLKKKQFEADKNASLIKAIISLAEGIAVTAGELGYPAALPFIALLAAEGALQIAAIESQPTPKFAKGVVGLKGKGTGTSDDIHAMLSRGESVVTAEGTNKHADLLKAINKGIGQDYIMKMLVAPALLEQQKKHDKNKQKSFADNIAMSMMLNNKGFYDGNLLESLKMSRMSEKQNAILIANAIKQNASNNRTW